MRYYYGEERRKDIEWGREIRGIYMAKWEGESVPRKLHKIKTQLNEFWVCDLLFVCFASVLTLCSFLSSLYFSTAVIFSHALLNWFSLLLQPNSEYLVRWSYVAGADSVSMFCPCLSHGVLCPYNFPTFSLFFFSAAGNANSDALIRNSSASLSRQAITSNNSRLGRQITWAKANAGLPPTNVQNLYNVSSSPTKKTPKNHLIFLWPKII